MTRIAALLAVAAVLAGNGAASRASSAADDPVGDLYVVSSAGGTRHALTSTPGYETQPALSPDGRSIALGGIRLMNVDGSNERAVGTAVGERPRWSPDGRSLVYSAGNGSLCGPTSWNCGFTDVWTVNADGTGARKILDMAVHPAWSPNGRQILFRDFVWGESGGIVASLKVASPDGSNVRTLSRAEAIDGQHSSAAWSPNGKWIAFNTYDRYHSLFVIRPDGSHRREVGHGKYPAWSPNGKSIAFESDQGISVVPLTGKHARLIDRGGNCPTWSPGGRWIAFLTPRVEGQTREGKLVVIRPDGHGRKVLAAAATCDSFDWAEPSPPVWSRDGRSIYFVG